MTKRREMVQREREEIPTSRPPYPVWTGDQVRDLFAFLHHEVDALNYRFNRADPEAMRLGLNRCRAYLDAVERDFLTIAERIIAEREDDPPEWVRR